MPQNPGPGRCVNCLSFAEERNWDHVFPRSWYPDSTPTNTAKWQIPSCIPCNDAHGKREKDLLIRLALCLDPEAPESAGIVERALRSIDADSAKSTADRTAREAKRQQLLRHVMEGADIPESAILPGFDETWGMQLEECAAITVPAESLRLLTIKIVRGLHFLHNQAYIEPLYSIDYYALRDDAEISTQLETHGERFAREPGIVALRLLVPEDGTSSFWRVTIFNRLRTYAVVSRADG